MTRIDGTKQVETEHYVVEYFPGRWEVRRPDGSVIYDDEPYGNDRPLIFRDEDVAIRFAERCDIDALKDEEEEA